MKPAIYYPWVYLKGGAERTILELMRRSRHEWTLYTNYYDPEATFPEFAEMNVVRLAEISVRRSIPKVAMAGLTLLTQRIDLTNHSSLFVVSEGLGNLLAMRSSVPTSCICLTPLKVAYDPVTREAFFAHRWRLHYRAAFELYKLLERPAWPHYRRVFCNSGEVKRRLLEARLVDEARLEVAYHGVDAGRFQSDGRREPFFLVPGRIMWQKNIQMAIAAWRRFKPRVEDNHFRLVVAGMVDTKSRPHLMQLQAESADRPDIEFVASPDDSELLSLYQRCHAVVFPARSEDWGLVALEGMACGKAVVATDRGGPRESVISGETGFLCPDDPEAFAVALRKLAAMSDHELDELAVRARMRALRFPWNGFVDRIDAHVEELAGAPVMAPVEVMPAAAVLALPPLEALIPQTEFAAAPGELAMLPVDVVAAQGLTGAAGD
jgi:glycosyltransferase involved in cell wall biosynthesis